MQRASADLRAAQAAFERAETQREKASSALHGLLAALGVEAA
jgi:hypothetical protein